MEELYYFEESTVTCVANNEHWHLQDHTYALPYPSTPPLIFSADIDDVSCNTTVETTAPGSSDVWAGSVTRCICGFQHDDGFMICCDGCSVWQHVDCMGISRTQIPDTYFCELCEPRPVDQYSAIRLQTRKSKIFADSASDTESGDEVPDGGPVRKRFVKRQTRRNSSQTLVSRNPREREAEMNETIPAPSSSASLTFHSQRRDSNSVTDMTLSHNATATSSLPTSAANTRRRRRSSLRMSSDQSAADEDGHLAAQSGEDETAANDKKLV